MKALIIAAALLLTGCGVKVGADALLWDGEVHMCRTIEFEDSTWSLCRTHQAVTPEVLREAQALAESDDVSLPVAIGRVTDWQNYQFGEGQK